MQRPRRQHQEVTVVDTPLLWHRTCAIAPKGRFVPAWGDIQAGRQKPSSSLAIPLPVAGLPGRGNLTRYGVALSGWISKS